MDTVKKWWKQESTSPRTSRKPDWDHCSAKVPKQWPDKAKNQRTIKIHYINTLRWHSFIISFGIQALSIKAAISLSPGHLHCVFIQHAGAS